jgi:DivIVA domain-containing protein
MPFAPHEIESKRFVTALRGYSADEVDAFLRAVAVDYRNALDEVPASRAEAAEIRAAAEREAAQIRAAAVEQANVAELRADALADAAGIRARAEREAAEIRDAAVRTAEAASAELGRRADELRRLEAALWSRVHALEQTVGECRQALSHVSGVHAAEPAGPAPTLGALPALDELLLRAKTAPAA